MKTYLLFLCLIFSAVASKAQTLPYLDVAESPSAVIRSYDLYFGHSSRKGNIGRALVDFKSSLVLNFANDWGTTEIHGLTTYISGNVGIGISNPQAKLAVNGTILATEIKVKTDITVPDYVFDDEYILPTLSETEAYIKANKHLPEVPSAKEVEEAGGVNLGEMNLLLLKKVEELTLHLIEQEKKQQEAITLLKNEIEILKTKVKQ